MQYSSDDASLGTCLLEGPQWRKKCGFLEKKIQNLQRANSELMKQVSEATQRAHRMAIYLGFNDLSEAESFITVHPDIFNRASIERSASLVHNSRLEFEKKEQSILIFDGAYREAVQAMQQTKEEHEHPKAELQSVEEIIHPINDPRERAPLSDTILNVPSRIDCDSCSSEKENEGLAVAAVRPVTSHKSIHPPSDHNFFRDELIHLHCRYELLVATKDRAAERYRRDYKKWNDFKRWLFDQDGKDQKALLGLDPPEAIRHKAAQMTKKRKRFEEYGPDLGETTTGDASGQIDGTRYDISSHGNTKKVKLATAQDFTSCDVRDIYDDILPHQIVESQYTRDIPRAFSPIAEFQYDKLHTSTPTLKSDPLDAAHDSRVRHTDSDVKGRPPASSTVQMDARGSSETDDNPHAPGALLSEQSIIVNCALSPRESARRTVERVHPDDSVTVRLRMDKTRALSPSSAGRRNVMEKTYKSHSRCQEDKQMHKAPPSLQVTDPNGYMKFKGRGRYAPDALEDLDSEINAQFIIEKSRNGGLDFQYDAIIRNKDDRRKLSAGDCECCRDYYEAVGPHPRRLEPPRWSSPSTSLSHPYPSEQYQCQHGSEFSKISDNMSSSSAEGQLEVNIAQHRKEISRHRHQWERPTTPPGYWNIGFPTTQEAANINQEAREMHRRKKEIVHAEAKKCDGRYRRR